MTRWAITAFGREPAFLILLGSLGILTKSSIMLMVMTRLLRFAL